MNQNRSSDTLFADASLRDSSPQLGRTTSEGRIKVPPGDWTKRHLLAPKCLLFEIFLDIVWICGLLFVAVYDTLFLIKVREGYTHEYLDKVIVPWVMIVDGAIILVIMGKSAIVLWTEFAMGWDEYVSHIENKFDCFVLIFSVIVFGVCNIAAHFLPPHKRDLIALASCHMVGRVICLLYFLKQAYNTVVDYRFLKSEGNMIFLPSASRAKLATPQEEGEPDPPLLSSFPSQEGRGSRGGVSWIPSTPPMLSSARRGGIGTGETSGTQRAGLQPKVAQRWLERRSTLFRKGRTVAVLSAGLLDPTPWDSSPSFPPVLPQPPTLPLRTNSADPILSPIEDDGDHQHDHKQTSRSRSNSVGAIDEYPIKSVKSHSPFLAIAVEGEE